MLEELWKDVCNIEKEAVTKTIPEKKKCKKAKWLFEEALKTAEERGEVKSKGERGRCTQQNAEFQRIAKRHKKAFLNEEYNEVEENNIFFKKSKYQRILYARMGTINDRKSKDLMKTQEIKKR